MQEFRSRIDDRLLHLVFRESEMDKFGRPISARYDLCPATEGLQVAYLQLMNEQTFRPHVHKERPREILITQECWVVVRGIVRVTFYDLDRKILGYAVLNQGDVTITMRGGHNYKAFTSPTRIVEVKTGPFVGAEADKEYLE